MGSGIEWTGETWNPTVGCSKVSPGCGMPLPGHDGEPHGNCYACGIAHRGLTETHIGLTVKREGEVLDWTGEVRCLPERLDVPLKRKKPTTYFVDSMSDLFHVDVPAEFIADVWTVMRRTHQHTYQILTKRPQRMAQVMAGMSWRTSLPDERSGWHAYPGGPPGALVLPNVHLGTSIETDRYAFRAYHLRATPAAVRFLSLEPLLGPLHSLDLTGLDWTIIGGESGPNSRPMELEWVREIIAKCDAAGVPVFVKQMGAVLGKRLGCSDRKGHDMDAWPEDLRRREMPQ